MTQISNVLGAGLVVLGLTLAGTALTNPSEVGTVERPFIKQADTESKLDGSEDAKVNGAVKLLIDTMFKERKVKEAFERYFLFSNLSPEEKRVLDATSLRYSEEHSTMDAGVVARILAAGWNYEYQPALLALGTKPLSDFDEAVEQADSEVEAERKRILSKRGLSENDFYTLLGGSAVKDRKTLEKNLTTLELINADIDRFIEQRTNKAVLNKNLVEMKKDISVKRINPAGHALYVVGVKPMFKVVFMPHNGILKMIGFGDAL